MEKRIQSIQRAINIMNCFNEEAPNLSLPQISEQLSLNINTTRGIVNTLVANGLMNHNKRENTYSLGSYFITKSNLLYNTQNIDGYIHIVQPYLEEITAKYSVLSSFQFVNEETILMVKTIQPVKAKFRINADLFSPLTHHCTSSGKLFLQYLPKNKFEEVVNKMDFSPLTQNSISSKEKLMEELKKQSMRLYSTEYDEQAIGISSVSAPILISNSQLVGTISVTAPTKVVKDHEAEMAKDLVYAAKRIESEVQFM